MTYLLPVPIKLAPTGEFRKVLQMGISCICAIDPSRCLLLRNLITDHPAVSLLDRKSQARSNGGMKEENLLLSALRHLLNHQVGNYSWFTDRFLLAQQDGSVGTGGGEDPLDASGKDGFGRCNPRAPHRGCAHAKSTESQRFEAFIWSHDL